MKVYVFEEIWSRGSRSSRCVGSKMRVGRGVRVESWSI